MSRVLRPNHDQIYLLPPALDEWVPPNHPVRFVRDFVDALDLSKLGIHEPKGEEGRPPYAADLLLKIWLFGYMERIRSTRALEKACLQVMPFLWLAGTLRPDHNTLWRFFDTNRKALPKLFKQLVKMAADADLVGFALHALDGTKLTAVSSTDEALHRKGLVERLKHLDEFIAAYMKDVSNQAEADKGGGYVMPKPMADNAARRARIQQLLERRLEDREDAQGLAKATGLAAGTGEQLTVPKDVSEPAPADDAEPPADGGAGTEPEAAGSEPPADPLLREAALLKNELEKKLAQLDEAGVNHLNEKEPEARMMKGRGGHALGYNAQIVVDHDSDLIVACDVVAQQNDLAQLVPMLEHVEEALGRVADQTVADGGYGSCEQLKRAEDLGMNVIVSLREEPDAKGAYSKAYFCYDPEKNAYVCPRDEVLLQVGTNKSHATTVHADAIYRCRNTTCPVRAECTKDPLGRKIRRPYGEDARDRQKAKQQDPRMRALLSLRKEIVEHLFGIAKTIGGFVRFTVRGVEKASAQWALVCMGVNLRKLSAMATFGAGKLLGRLLNSAPAAAPLATR